MKNKNVKGLFLLTTKPVLYVANVAEDEVADGENNPYVNKWRNLQQEMQKSSLFVHGQKKNCRVRRGQSWILEAMGIEESGWDQLIVQPMIYWFSDLFTAYEQEVRAWP